MIKWESSIPKAEYSATAVMTSLVLHLRLWVPSLGCSEVQPSVNLETESGFLRRIVRQTIPSLPRNIGRWCVHSAGQREQRGG